MSELRHEAATKSWNYYALMVGTELSKATLLAADRAGAKSRHRQHALNPLSLGRESWLDPRWNVRSSTKGRPFFGVSSLLYGMMHELGIVPDQIMADAEVLDRTLRLEARALPLGDIKLGHDARRIAKARVAGFLFGCALGAWCEAAIALRAIVLPASLALVALALGLTTGFS